MKKSLAFVCFGLLIGAPAWAQEAPSEQPASPPSVRPKGPTVPRTPRDAPKAPVTPGLPPGGSDTPSLQPVPPTGTLERVPASGVVPAPKTGDERMEKPAPSTGPNEGSAAPGEVKPNTQKPPTSPP